MKESAAMFVVTCGIWIYLMIIHDDLIKILHVLKGVTP